jgi:hypothetical protein
MITAVYAGNVLVIQFDVPEDAGTFIQLYGSEEVLLHAFEQEENYERTVFTHLPSDEFCRELIAYKVGVKI